MKHILMVLTLALPASAQMTILQAEGDVFVRPRGSAVFRAVQPGEVLPIDSLVMTRENGRAVLVGRNGALHRLGPDSRLVVPPIEGSGEASPLYTAALAKQQSQQNTRLSMTRVAATRGQDETTPLQDQPLTERERSQLEAILSTLAESGIEGGALALVQGAIFEQYGQWARAEAVYLSALKADPQNPQLRASLSDLYFKQGRYQLAQSLRTQP